MISRRRTALVGAATAGIALGVALAHRDRWSLHGTRAAGGVLIADVGRYDLLSRFVLDRLFKPIAAEIAAIAPAGGEVLDVGCGPGHLSVRLARDHGLRVTGVDLDPAMVDRATTHATASLGDSGRPTFLVADVAHLPFANRTFDVVVSTFSMHHWADLHAGASEIDRVLRPGGRAIVWDLGHSFRPFHRASQAPALAGAGSPLANVQVTPWRWPWRISLADRMEFTRPADTVAPTDGLPDPDHADDAESTRAHRGITTG